MKGVSVSPDHGAVRVLHIMSGPTTPDTSHRAQGEFYEQDMAGDERRRED
jgi:hypothetical protein